MLPPAALEPFTAEIAARQQRREKKLEAEAARERREAAAAVAAAARAGQKALSARELKVGHWLTHQSPDCDVLLRSKVLQPGDGSERGLLGDEAVSIQSDVIRCCSPAHGPGHCCCCCQGHVEGAVHKGSERRAMQADMRLLLLWHVVCCQLPWLHCCLPVSNITHCNCYNCLVADSGVQGSSKYTVALPLLVHASTAINGGLLTQKHTRMRALADPGCSLFVLPAQRDALLCCRPCLNPPGRLLWPA